MGIPYYSTGAYGQSFSCDVKDCLDYFDIPTNVFAYNSDGGGNLLTWKIALDHVDNNSDIFNPKQLIFRQSCIAHVLQGAHKAAIINVESDDKIVIIVKILKSLQKVWTGMIRVTRA